MSSGLLCARVPCNRHQSRRSAKRDTKETYTDSSLRTRIVSGKYRAGTAAGVTFMPQPMCGTPPGEVPKLTSYEELVYC